jgi:putative phosphoesterase
MMAMTEVLVMADTHLSRGHAGRLIERLAGELASADVILHAGDITDRSVLDALADAASTSEVVAVLGNNDVALTLPERVEVTVGGCRVAMVHDSGAAGGRTRRLRRWFPDADLVVFGHSHLPWHEIDVRSTDGHVQHQLNPGSAILRRRAPTCTVARVVIADGVVVDVRHVPVG